MATGQTGKKIDARERARLARTRVDQVRAERDALAAKIVALEATMGDRVTSLFELGESASRIVDLTALAPKEVKRMRSHAAATLTTPVLPKP